MSIRDSDAGAPSVIYNRRGQRNMSKRKRRSPQPHPKPTPAPTPPQAPAATTASEPSAPAPARRRVPVWLFAVIGLALIGAVAVILAATQPRTAPRAVPRPPASVGAVNACRKFPQFAEKLGYSRSAVLDSSDSLNINITGLALLDPPAAGSTGQTRVYTHTSWDDAGHLGPIVIDWDGNAYTVPTPRINLYTNPIDQQSKVFKIDAATGVMSEFLRLPGAAPATQANPYGTLGLALDCETRSLYVSSVSGSDREREIGRIYRVDLSGPQPKITSQVEGVDALGLGVFKGIKARRLYFGGVRAAVVRSIVLDDKGDFYGDVRDEVSLVGVFGDGEDKARRINFTNTEMQVRGIEFSFNLVAAREKTETRYAYAYESASDTWRFTGASAVGKGEP